MMALNIERATRDMSGAADFLLGHDAVTGQAIAISGGETC